MKGSVRMSNMSLPIGSCWVGGFDEDKVKSLLKAPANHRPVGILVCGYNNSKIQPNAHKPVEEVVTFYLCYVC